MTRNLKVISVPAPAMRSTPRRGAPSGRRGGTRFSLMIFAPCEGGMMRGRLCGSAKNANTLGKETGIQCSAYRRWLMAKEYISVGAAFQIQSETRAKNLAQTPCSCRSYDESLRTLPDIFRFLRVSSWDDRGRTARVNANSRG